MCVCVLIVTAVVSTNLIVGLYAIHGPFSLLLPIDCLINVICVCLLFQQWETWYYRLCKPCTFLVTKCLKDGRSINHENNKQSAENDMKIVNDINNSTDEKQKENENYSKNTSKNPKSEHLDMAITYVQNSVQTQTTKP